MLKFIWKYVEVWEYPIEKIRNLTPNQVKKRTFQ